jgi:hypothetical protein
MAARSNFNNKRQKPEYTYTGGSSRPQMVPPKPPSLNPASTSLSPVTVVYWGYWKKQDEVIQIASTTGVSNAVGITGAGGIRTTGTIGTDTAGSPVSLLNPPKPPTSQVGETVPSQSKGSSVFQVSPASGSKGGTKDKIINPTESTTTPQQGKFTDQEIIQGVSGITEAFKESGWADKSIIAYFLTPSSLGYRQFPGITTELFVKAVNGIIDVSSLVGGKSSGSSNTSSGSGGFNTRGLV